MRYDVAKVLNYFAEDFFRLFMKVCHNDSEIWTNVINSLASHYLLTTELQKNIYIFFSFFNKLILPRSQNGIIRMFGGHRSCNFSCQIVQFDGGHSWIKAIDDLHGDSRSIDKVHVQIVAQFLNTGSDFIKMDWLFSAIPFLDEQSTVLPFFDHFEAIKGY